jgi:hypothetical protein
MIEQASRAPQAVLQEHGGRHAKRTGHLPNARRK